MSDILDPAEKEALIRYMRRNPMREMAERDTEQSIGLIPQMVQGYGAGEAGGPFWRAAGDSFAQSGLRPAMAAAGSQGRIAQLLADKVMPAQEQYAAMKGVKDSGKVADASEAFAERGKAAPSTEQKIAQLYGETGEVRDAMPILEAQAKEDFGRAQLKGKDMTELRNSGPTAYNNPRNAPPKSEKPMVKGKSALEPEVDADARENLNPPKLYYKPEGVKGNVLRADGMQGPSEQPATPQDRFWHDENDHSFTDEAKSALDNLANRYGENDAEVIEALRLAQHAPAHKPYTGIGEHSFDKHMLPNYSAKPTGVIGEPTIQDAAHPNSLVNEPFPWMDDKYKAGKQLLLRHKSIGMPAEIHTSSDLIGKQDYIAAIPKGSTVHIHLMSPDPGLNRLIFPGNPSNQRLMSAAESLKEAGVNVQVHQPSIEKLMKAVEDADLRDRWKGVGLNNPKEVFDFLKRRGMLTEAELKSNVKPITSIYKRPLDD